MNIFKREIKANLKSSIIWSICIIFFIAMSMQKYDALVSTGVKGMMSILNDMPKSLQSIFGMSTLDITTPIGYYGALYIYLLLLAAIHAVMLGTNIIAKEEKDKTSEFLMTKPVTRSNILLYKLIYSVVNILVLNIIIFLSSLIALRIFTSDNLYNVLILLTVGILVVQLLFLSIGIFISSIANNQKKSSTYAMSILLGTFFLSLIIDVFDKLKVLNIFTPFQYFDAKVIIPDNKLNIFYIIISLIIIIICLIISYNKYKKKDMYI